QARSTWVWATKGEKKGQKGRLNRTLYYFEAILESFLSLRDHLLWVANIDVVSVHVLSVSRQKFSRWHAKCITYSRIVSAIISIVIRQYAR
ncbi:MAG: hypothetical protein WCF65_07455, partial [Parachlamydiaceae bacterium]